MQKIAIVSPRLPMGGAVGGAETLLLNLARLAAEGGAEPAMQATAEIGEDPFDDDGRGLTRRSFM